MPADQILTPVQAYFVERFLHAGEPPRAEDSGEADRLRAALGRQQVGIGMLSGEVATDALGLAAEISGQIDAGQFDDARNGLNELAALVRSAEGRLNDLKDLADLGAVSLGIAAHDWRAAAQKVAGQIESARDEMFAAFDADDVAVQAKKLDTLAAQVELFGDDLADAFDRLLEAPVSDRPAAAEAALRVARPFLAFARDDALLRHVAGHPLDADRPDVANTLTGPLSALVDELANIR